MGELMKKIKFLFAIIFIFIFQLCIKCYGVDITSNVMYEYDAKSDTVQAVLYTSCAASDYSKQRYIDELNKRGIPLDEAGYYWVDLQVTEPEDRVWQ